MVANQIQASVIAAISPKKVMRFNTAESSLAWCTEKHEIKRMMSKPLKTFWPLTSNQVFYIVQDPTGFGSYKYCAILDIDDQGKVTNEVKSTMRKRRNRPVVLSVGDYIYVCGGAFTTTAERLNRQTNEWRFIPPLNVERELAQGCTIGTKLYLTGGGDQNATWHRSIEMLDTSTIGQADAAWQLIEIDSEHYTPRTYGKAFSMQDNEILIFGGKSIKDGGFCYHDEIISIKLDTLECEVICSEGVEQSQPYWIHQIGVNTLLISEGHKTQRIFDRSAKTVTSINVPAVDYELGDYGDEVEHDEEESEEEEDEGYYGGIVLW